MLTVWLWTVHNPAQWLLRKGKTMQDSGMQGYRLQDKRGGGCDLRPPSLARLGHVLQRALLVHQAHSYERRTRGKEEDARIGGGSNGLGQQLLLR